MAIAANFSVEPATVIGSPYTALRGIPANGTLLLVTLYADPTQSTHGLRALSLPLRLEDFNVQRAWETQPSPRVPQYLLVGQLNGFQLDVRSYFGTQEPSGAQLASAQEELNCLSVPRR
jgi:hypothetical protein